VGVGVRRESKLGPHLGQGFGGRWVLKGDIDEDRAAVVLILKKLIDQVECGDLDDILSGTGGLGRSSGPIPLAQST
jgi:hypothetical protein